MFRLLEFSEKIVKYIAIIALLAMVVMVFTNVTLRYAFNSGLPWSEEVARLCFVWVVFLGIILAAKDKAHLKVDVLTASLPPNAALILSYITRCITIFIMYALIVGGVKLMKLTYNQGLPASGISTAYLYLAGVLGAIVILVMTIFSFVQSATYKREDITANQDKESK